MKLRLNQLHEAQAEVLSKAKRYNVVSCGRRWGKSTLGIDNSVNMLVEGMPVGWFAPSYKILMDAWRQFESVLDPIVTFKNKQDKRIEVITGGSIEFWSLDRDGAGRSRKYALATIDEAAMVRNLEQYWTEAIRPTLADYGGGAWFFSTPKGRNYFWRLWNRGMDAMGDWASFQMPTSSNPFIDPSEVEALKQELPDRAFRQEVMAEFLDDGGGVFRFVRDAVTEREDAPAHPITIGVDWGKMNDYTVITAMDADYAVVEIDRIRQIDYRLQLDRVESMYKRHQARKVVVERNSIGDPLIEELTRRQIPVEAFNTTHRSKADIIDGLVKAFEDKEIKLYDDLQHLETIIAELEAYEMTRLPSGLFRYEAPSGMHDDCVMSLAMARHGARRRRMWIVA